MGRYEIDEDGEWIDTTFPICAPFSGETQQYRVVEEQEIRDYAHTLESKLAERDAEVGRLENALTEARSMVDGADLSWLLSRCPACGHEMSSGAKADSCPQCAERFKAHWHYNHGAGHTPKPEEKTDG